MMADDTKTEVEITPQMIEAGVAVLIEQNSPDVPAGHLLKCIYVAMMAASEGCQLQHSCAGMRN